MHNNYHRILLTTLFTLTLVGSYFFFMTPPVVTEGQTNDQTNISAQPLITKKEKKTVIIYLNSMTLELRENGITTKTLPILSKGKPGSYYETIGGVYTNDYKTPLHFSSIGHVYMPYSIHLFGNYFIHGVPYYPDGRAVSSTYSGGCIRLANDDASVVYNFIDKGTTIIVTKEDKASFAKTIVESASGLTSIKMTNLMVATISLELLQQDSPITDTDTVTVTTRRAVLPRLITDGDSTIAHLYASSITEDNFIRAMNQKAEALGLSNTVFYSVDAPVATTYEDYERFMTYISTYKSYLRTLQNTQPNL